MHSQNTRMHSQNTCMHSQNTCMHSQNTHMHSQNTRMHSQHMHLFAKLAANYTHTLSKALACTHTSVQLLLAQVRCMKYAIVINDNLMKFYIFDFVYIYSISHCKIKIYIYITSRHPLQCSGSGKFSKSQNKC